MAKGLGKMIKEAQKLEKRLAQVKESLRSITVEGTSGGGAVKVTMNGQHDVVALAIEPDVLDATEPDMVEDLLLSALRDAKNKADELAEREMSKVAGALRPPGLL